MKPVTGDVVKIEYTGTLNNGDVFDSNVGGELLEFTIGEGLVIPGFETLVLGLEEGESGKATLDVEEAYGPRHEEQIITVENDFFGDFKPEEGWMLSLESEDGQQVPALVVEIGEENTRLDLNHPLAGQELTFDVRLVEVIKPS